MADKPKKHKVLVIDDEVLIREVVKAALNHSNFEAVTLESPSLAESVIKTTRPDLIVMDLYMPELDGLQILHRLKKDPETAKIPVIVLSGSNEKIDVLSTQQAGVYEYITKPVDNRVLISKIKQVLGLPKDAR